MATQLSYGQFSQYMKRKKNAKSTEIDKAWRNYQKSGDLTSAVRGFGNTPNPLGPGSASDPIATSTILGNLGGVISGSNPVGPSSDANPYSIKRYPETLTKKDWPWLNNLPNWLLPDIGGPLSANHPSNSPTIPQAPSASMPGEHSGPRIATTNDNNHRGGPTGRRMGAHQNSPSSPMDDALAQIMAEYNQALSGGSGPAPSYHDFSAKAAAQTADIYGPLFDALTQQEGRARQQYGQNDALVKRLYAKLQSDLQGQVAGTQQTYSGLQQGNQQHTNELVSDIQGTYGSEQNKLAGVMQQLGIQAAAPISLAPGSEASAYQQAQALQGGKANADYLTNVGQNMQNFQGGLVNAAGAQGAVSRESLIKNLGDFLMELSGQRAQLGSQRASSTLSQANSLADRDFAAQGASYDRNRQSKLDALDNLKQQYGFLTNADQTNYDRGFQQQELFAKQQAAQQQTPNYSGLGQLSQALQSTYPGQNTAGYINIASQVAGAGSYQNGAFNDTGSFINEIVKKAQQAYGPNFSYEAAMDVAQYFAKMMNFKTTGM